MGLFTPAEFKPFKFKVPASPEEFMTHLFTGGYPSRDDAYPWVDMAQQYYADVKNGVDPSDPPLNASIYLERVDNSGLRVRAGNRSSTYWTITIDFAGNRPTTGHVSFERKSGMWPGNVLRLRFELQMAANALS